MGVVIPPGAPPTTGEYGVDDVVVMSHMPLPPATIVSSLHDDDPRQWSEGTGMACQTTALLHRPHPQVSESNQSHWDQVRGP